jgi:hypothetical protein
MIIATKYTANYKSGGKASKHPISINRCVGVEYRLSRPGTVYDGARTEASPQVRQQLQVDVRLARGVPQEAPDDLRGHPLCVALPAVPTARQIRPPEPWLGAGTALIQADVHWWDWTTPVAEMMQGLNNLVKMGKGEHARVHLIRWEGVTGGTGVIMLRIRAVLMTPTQCSTLAYLTLRRG